MSFYWLRSVIRFCKHDCGCPLLRSVLLADLQLARGKAESWTIVNRKPFLACLCLFMFELHRSQGFAPRRWVPLTVQTKSSASRKRRRGTLTREGVKPTQGLPLKEVEQPRPTPEGPGAWTNKHTDKHIYRTHHKHKTTSPGH